MSNPLALLGRAATYLVLSLAAFISVFPFFWMVIGSTNTNADLIRGKSTPGDALWRNIEVFFSSADMPRVFFNSFFIAGLGTALTLLVSSLAGYGFEIFRSRIRERVFAVLLLMLSVPFATLMIPLFILMANLKMMNTYQAIILPTVASIFIIFYFRQATKAFPHELRDAARIDGLKEWQIFLYVYLPVMRSTYAAATIIVFMAHWNNYLWPLIVLQTNDMKTLPTLIIFFLLQRRFVEGMLGAVK